MKFAIWKKPISRILCLVMRNLPQQRRPPMADTNFSTGLQSANLIEITVTGRTSGRPLTYPIWFALDGDKLYLIPVKGSDTEWYKNLRKTPTIRLQACGKTLTTNARLITDQGQLDKVLEKFRDKYGRNVKSYYPKYDVAVEVPLE
jgi:deazaflavin-dependent oxidoreductase (nitroreductase family)